MLENYSSKTIDHLGLVSGLCKDINLVKIIDDLLPKKSDNAHISFGQLFLAWFCRSYFAYVSSIF